MDVSTTGKSWEAFATRISTHEIYWGISQVKSQCRTDVDPLKFDVGLFVTQNMTTPEKYGPDPQTVQFLIEVAWVPTHRRPLVRAWFPQ